MTFIRTHIAHIAIALAFLLTAGTVALAQTYQWTPLGVVSASWAANGIHIYNTNAGSVVIGTLSPSGDLLLDVAGQIGASEFCDEDGTESSCFTATDMTWRLAGSDIYNTNSGNVGIGTNTPSQKLEINGNVLATRYYYTSDQRLKTNITPIRGLETITQLEGVRFNWIDSGKPSIGLIAQDVEQVLPELVSTNPDTGIKAVEYANIVAPLIEAVKEQQREIEELQAMLESIR